MSKGIPELRPSAGTKHSKIDAEGTAGVRPHMLKVHTPHMISAPCRLLYRPRCIPAVWLSGKIIRRAPSRTSSHIIQDDRDTPASFRSPHVPALPCFPAFSCQNGRLPRQQGPITVSYTCSQHIPRNNFFFACICTLQNGSCNVVHLIAALPLRAVKHLRLQILMLANISQTT